MMSHPTPQVPEVPEVPQVPQTAQAPQAPQAGRPDDAPEGARPPAPPATAPLAGQPVWRQRLQPVLDFFWVPPQPLPVPGMASFERAADGVMSAQATRRAQQIVRLSLALVIVLLIWAAFARVDEVTRGEGRVVPSRQLQVLQALDGGVVAEIKVKEGEVVEAGQLLLRIDETRATSGVRESEAQGFALQARQARLRALAEGSGFSPPSAGDESERRIVEEERRLYESKQSELSTLMST